MPTTVLLPLLAAPFAGSFLGVLVRRLPDNRSVVRGRSRCEHCGRALGPAELVPLLSFVALRGRCRGCRAPIDPFHPLVELAALAVAASALLDPSVSGGPEALAWGAADIDWTSGAGWLWADCVLGWGLLALAWIDAERWLLPDALTLPLLLAGLLATALLDPADLSAHALGAALGFGLLRGAGLLYRRLRGHDGLGGGDAKLLAASGAWLGWAPLPDVLLLAALLGLAWAGLLRLRGRRLGASDALPFGPMLALATWGVRVWGVG